MGREHPIFSQTRGHVYFAKEEEGREECIRWYAEDELGWPSGWYFEVCPLASYFIQTDDMNCLPISNWAPYEAPAYSKPGEHPAPMIRSQPLEAVQAEP